MNKNFLIIVGILLVAIVGVIVYYLFYSESAVFKRINSYDDCIAAGYPSLEMFPPQCKTPDGRTFVSAETLTPTQSAALANPASVNCENLGGKLEIRTEATGQVGYCTLPDGKTCEEWALLEGECK